MNITEDFEVPADCCGYKGIKRVLISENDIRTAVVRLGELITKEYAGKPLLVVGILKGSFIFLADLCRQIRIPCEIDFLAAESYGSGTVSAGDVRITRDISRDISQYHVVIVEDIVDTGHTLARICDILRERKPLSLCTAALLDKPDRRETDFRADHVLFTVPDIFVVGYGLDCGERFRNLPYIAEAEL